MEVFWDSHDVVLIDCLEKGKTLNREYYTALLEYYAAFLENNAIRAKCPHLTKKKVVFRYDNAASHTFSIVVAKLFELRLNCCHTRCSHQI